jgi:serine/threonine protein kinase/ABC-type glycerol-3-phosphate transport system substrate-binding protein/class 3 adenylate cyclase
MVSPTVCAASLESLLSLESTERLAYTCLWRHVRIGDMHEAANRRGTSLLPRGTVTLLFTDIEGSTRILQSLGEGSVAVLAEHHRILRRAAAEQGGREIDNQGDSFLFAFERANAALGAAVLAQRALSEHPWPEGGEIRVRMGLHTGEPTIGEERYVGLGVHRAARIGAVAHGGQVLLSNATRELLEDGLAGVSIRDLGLYRLKDLDRDERLYQLDVAGLKSDFPPLSAQRVAEPLATSPTEVKIGAEFLGYRIEEQIGRGGMGVVYRAYDLRLRRTVALKLVTPELAVDDRFRERFVRETELAMSLEHPNVVPVHDAGEVAGRLYLAMRLVAGTDLRELLRAQGALEPARALAICRQLANALDAAHARALVHGDVKPSNVLLDESEHVYLADFGLTRRLDEQGSPASESRSIGTPAYLAPERIAGEPIDRRADVYSLGCLLYECLVGEPPFAADSRLGVAWAHLEEEPPRASERNPDLPDAIDAVIRRALAKSPEDRYPTCASLAADAEAAVGLKQPPIFLRDRRLLLVAAVLVILVAALVSVAIYVRSDSQSAAAGSAENPITILSAGDETEQAAFRKVLRAFEEKSGLKTHHETALDILPAIRRRLAGNPPMLATGPSPGALADLAREGLLKDLASLGLRSTYLDQNYGKAWLDLGTADGKTYAFPVRANSKSVFWYRPDDFETLGLTVPKTWAELLAVTKKLEAAGRTPWALGARDSWTLTDWFENIYIRTGGPARYRQLFAGELSFDHPSVITALTQMTTILSDRYVAGGIRGALGNDLIRAIALVFGQSPSADLLMEGGFVGTIALAEVNPSLEPGKTIAEAPFPTIDPRFGNPLVGGGELIVAFVDNEAVRELLVYLSSQEGATVSASTGEIISPNKRVPSSAYPNDLIRAEAKQVAGAKVFAFDGSDLLPESLSEAWGSTLQNAIAKPGDIPKLLTDFQRTAEREFNE